jgi:hypothetical protein
MLMFELFPGWRVCRDDLLIRIEIQVSLILGQ